MTDHNATDAISRRTVLKATGGLLASATLFPGAGGAATEAEPEPQFEIEDANEEVIIAKVWGEDPLGVYSLGEVTYLGLADDFIAREDSVSLPEDTEPLAQSVEVERVDEETYRMYFRTRDIAWPEEKEGEEVTLGVGIFPERTMPIEYWDAEPIPFPCC